MSLAGCSILCAKDSCCSVLFDEMTQRCITYSAFARSNVTGCGWKYAEVDLDMCNKCDHGYSYDALENKCRTVCVSYGSTYGRFDGYILNMIVNSNNTRMIKRSWEQACKDACTAETTFECRIAELRSDYVCFLSVETALTRPDIYYQHSSFTLWHRNCA